MVWGVLIVWYLFLAGVAAGTYLTSAFIEMKYPENKKIRKAGRLLTPVLLAIGLIFLMVDAEAGLHNPLRFFALIMNPGSVMTIGVYVICIFMAISIVSAIFELRGKNTPRVLTWIGVAFALGLAAYTGFLLGVVQAYPLWNNAALPILFVLSALSTGISASSLLGITDHKSFEAMISLRKSHVILLGLEVVVLAIMLVIVGSSGNTATESALMIVTGSLAPLFWIGVVMIGLILPLSIEVLRLRKAAEHESASVSRGIGIAAEVGVLVGGFLLRYVIIMAALPIALL